MFKGTNIIEFGETFPDEETCYKYIADEKWKDEYKCIKCGNTSYCKGRTIYSRRCIKCKYDESVTANTLFHKCKFSIKKALYIVFMVVTSKKGISAYELSRRLSLRRKTCHDFKTKVVQAMKSSKDHPLKGSIEADEFTVGGKEEGVIGREKGKKQEVALAIEVDGFGIHRGYGQVIENAGTKELKSFFEDFVDKEAKIRTDKWRGYQPLKKKYQNLIQEESNGGKSFEKIHRFIMMFKAWLRGIHHHCNHLQAYIDEYTYRFNRLKYPRKLFHNLLNKMINSNPITVKQLKMAYVD